MQPQDVQIKPAFEERYSALTDFDAFKKYSLTYLRRAIRVNTLKITVEECAKKISKDWNLTPIPWCKEGFWVEHKEGRRDIGNAPEYLLGYFYVQEAASMIPPLVLQPQPGDLVLDMCASPGSKTSQMLAMMKGEGMVIANDYKGDRMPPLGLNLQRIGSTNHIITLMDGNWYAKSGILFDKILLDAPCSGTGTIRKSLKTLLMWNPGGIRKLAKQQRKLLETAFSVLKPGGEMVYSTCSCEPEENEGVISDFLSEHSDASLLSVDLPGLKRSDAVTSFEGKAYDPTVEKSVRIWPQDNDTEGFFVCKIKKNEL